MADNVNVGSLSGQILPSVYFKQITIKEEGDNNNIKLDLVVRDVLEEGESSNLWIFDSDFTQYIQIRILQSVNEQTTKEIRKSDNIDDYFLNPPGDDSYSFLGTIPIQKDGLTDGDRDGVFELSDYSRYVAKTGQTIYEIKYSTTTVVPKEKNHLTYFAAVFIDIEKLSEDYGISWTNGVVRGLMTQELVLSNGKANTKSYVFYLTETNQIWDGEYYLSSDGSTYKTAAEYALSPDGKTYNYIPLPKSASGADNPRSKNLRREEVINPKINDLREAKKLQELPDLKPALKSYQNVAKTQPDRRQQKNNSTYSYISQPLISRNSKGEVGALFHVDIDKIIKEQSAFGNIFESSSDVRARLIMRGRSRIKNFKLLRRRIDKTLAINKLGTPQRAIIFDESRGVQENLISTSDSTRPGLAVLASKSNDKAEILELDILPNVRTFSFLDKNIRNKTDGEYQYGILIEMEDGVVTYMNDALDRLIEVRSELDLYYSDATSSQFANPDGTLKPSLGKKYVKISSSTGTVFGTEPIWNRAIGIFMQVYGALTSKEKIGIGQLSRSELVSQVLEKFTSQEKLDLYDQIVEGNLVYLRGRFSQESLESVDADRLEDIQSVFENLVSLIKEDEISIPRFLESLKDAEIISDFEEKFANIKSFENIRNDTENLLYSMINPNTGTEQGIYAFIEAYSVLTAHLEKALEGKRTPQQDQGSLVGGSKKSYKASTLFVEKFFLETQDTSISKNLGIDFLAKPNRSSLGLKAILYSDLDDRVTAETQTYWNSTDFDKIKSDLREDKDTIAGDTSEEVQELLYDLSTSQYAFLTPAVISAGAYSINRMTMGAKKWNSTVYNAIAANIVALGSRNYTEPATGKTSVTIDSPGTTTSSKSARKVTHKNAIDNIMNQMGLVFEDPAAQKLILEAERRDPDIAVGNILGSNDPVALVGDEELTENEEIVQKKLQSAREKEIESKIALGNIFVNNLTVTNALGTGENSSKVSLYKSVSIKSIRQYDLFNSSNVLDEMLNNASEEDKEELVKMLPNQIRSLMFSESDTTRLDWFNYSTSNPPIGMDPFQTPEMTQMMRFNYDTLCKIMVFTGFDTGVDGEISIAQPRFVPLTSEILLSNRKKLLICKMAYYKNEALGIGTNSNMNIPIYDQVFLLSPESSQLVDKSKNSVGIDVDPTTYTKKYSDPPSSSANYSSSGSPVGVSTKNPLLGQSSGLGSPRRRGNR